MILSSYIQRISQLYDEKEAREIAFRLLEHHTQKSRIELLITQQLSDSVCCNIEKDLRRLLNHEPIQYILGESFFYGYRFKVDTSVLIPRRETEELVHFVALEYQSKENLKILDIGTGSGCIAIMLAKLLPQAEVFAVEKSEKALEVAHKNALLHQVSVHFIHADVFSTFYSKLPAMDIIVSNPPYVTESEKRLIRPNVFFEPAEALFVPDEQPLVFYERIAELADILLVPCGKVFCEINERFPCQVKELFQKAGFEGSVWQDMQQKFRFLKATRMN
ncbi:MAG: peptide chain release factor N(5)-glutamine methyltransferase [Cytophagales bacterium]|nr:peptide chain release factor N(5)-glutamine methyltransferase [Cytophagales bacterium]MDW8384469.1 peptide chain release factor N(5)-glutamine methyltransferase [Flammeovirgaceae bacterium]